MKARFAVQKVRPLEYREVGGFAMTARGCTYAKTTVPVYPHSDEGEELRRLRLEKGMTLTHLAIVWRMGVVDVSGLERGALTLLQHDWAQAFAALEDMEHASTPGHCIPDVGDE